jgi:hypothetical protein
MRKTVSTLSLALLLFSSAAQSQGNLTELSYWMSHYYEDPQPEHLAAWIKDTSSAGAFEKPNSRVTVLFFVSEIIKSNPKITDLLCSDISRLPQELKFHLGWSFFNANTPSAETCFRSKLDLSERDINKIESLERYSALSKEPTSPADIEFLWTTFFATGEKTPINKIIDVLGKSTPEKTPESIEIVMLKNTVKLSLFSNIKLHNRVAEIAENRLSQESGLLGKELSELINSAAN